MEKIKKAMDEENRKDKKTIGGDDGKVNKKLLPKGVAVICHQNFEDFAGPFAHSGLYLPLQEKVSLKRKQESTNKGEKTSKKQKTKEDEGKNEDKDEDTE